MEGANPVMTIMNLHSLDDQPIRILIVDDDVRTEEIFHGGFPEEDYEIHVSAQEDSAVGLARDHHPHFVFLELQIEGVDSLQVLARLRALNEETAIIVLSKTIDHKRVSQALELGAEDFIAKPFDSPLIEIAMKNILEKRTLQDQISRLKGELERDHVFGMLVGESNQIIEVRELVEQVAKTDLNILIRGESGTGKDVTARLIHQLSNHKDGPFVKVNCAALPENLIEAELFGHEKGAFTGAVRAKPGRFQLAHGGTIFLDEVTEIPFPLQSKLLQVLEQREFVRVGGTRTVKVDCRCITATNAFMEEEMAHKRFREDLFFRMNEFSIHLPPLRERREDIPLLVNYFLSLYSEKYHRQRNEIHPETIRLMMGYPWPGNVRELESLLKRMLVLDSEEIILQTIGGGTEENRSLPDRSRQHTLPSQTRDFSQDGFSAVPGNRQSFEIMEPRGDVGVAVAAKKTSKNLKEIVEDAVERAEREAILTTLQDARWNRRRAAKDLGISYSSLLRRIAKYELGGD
jgi:DNA-binding NtrC family response regulator